MGRVDRTPEHIRVGYHAHPAVTDSSMHLGVYLGSSDGQTRVPGIFDVVLGLLGVLSTFCVCLKWMRLSNPQLPWELSQPLWEPTLQMRHMLGPAWTLVADSAMAHASTATGLADARWPTCRLRPSPERQQVHQVLLCMASCKRAPSCKKPTKVRPAMQVACRLRRAWRPTPTPQCGKHAALRWHSGFSAVAAQELGV